MELRQLPRNGSLERRDKILLGKGEPGAAGPWPFKEYARRALGDGPLHFLLERRSEFSPERPYLVAPTRENHPRVAITVCDENPRQVRWYGDDICGAAAVFDNPKRTKVSLREGWEEAQDSSSRMYRDLVTAYDVPEENP